MAAPWRALGLMLLLAMPDAARADPSAQGADEPPPWAADAWLNARPRLLGVHLRTRPGRLELEFRPRDDPRIIMRRPAPDRIELHLPEIDAPPRLPITETPFVELEWRSAEVGSALGVRLVAGTRIVLHRRGASWSLEVVGEAPAPDAAPAPPAVFAEPDPRWASTSDAADFEAELHRAVAEAHDGRGPHAIMRLRALLRGDLPRPVRAAVHLVEARLARREGLLVLALDSAARVSRWTADPLARTASHELSIDIEDRLPGALSLVAHDLAPDLIARGRAGDEAMLFAVARALLRLDDPHGAARLLHRVHLDRRWRQRARFLAHVAARQANDRRAAEQHLVALAAYGRDRLAPRLRVELALAWARHSYESAPARARQAYATAQATAADVEPGGPRVEAIRVEQGWLDLRAGDAVGPLSRLLPLDLDAHGPPRALLVAALYHRLCHPLRASAVASAIIDRLELDAIQRQLAVERGILGREVWAPVRAGLLSRIDELADRYEQVASLSPEAFWRRQALRVRVSANARASAEVVERMREDRQPPPEEPPPPRWRGAVWAETDPVADRCAALKLAPPFDAVSGSARGDPPGASIAAGARIRR